jgi:hypothetical protein
MREVPASWTPEERKKMSDLLQLESDLLAKRDGIDVLLRVVGKNIERYWTLRQVRQRIGEESSELDHPE